MYFSFHCSTRSYMETKGWDVFRTIPPEQESGSESFDRRYIGFTVKLLKVIAYIVCFIVVLGGSVISKATILFMTSQIRPQKSIQHCNLDLERDKSYQADISTPERVNIIGNFGIYLRFRPSCRLERNLGP